MQRKISIELVVMVVCTITVLTMFLTMGAGSPSGEPIEKDHVRTVTVQGKAVVKSEPDITKFTFTASAFDATADVAQNAVNTKINNALEYIREVGISYDDIVTQRIQVYPRMEWQSDGARYVASRQVQTGVDVSCTVELTVRDFDLVSGIITHLTNVQIDRIGQLSYELENQEEAYAEALKIAYGNARDKAAVFLDKTEVLRVYSVNESSWQAVPYTRNAVNAKTDDAAYESVATEYFAADVGTSATVEITFEIIS